MRVRIWIEGEDGPSRDFELIEAPRVGECISISVSGQIEEGVVRTVIWQLVAIERSGNDLVLGVEPAGSVAMVHVICRPSRDGDVMLSDQTARELVIESAPTEPE